MYLYSSANRLQDSVPYMYSAYEGAQFLDAYTEDRVQRVRSLVTSSAARPHPVEEDASALFQWLLEDEGGFPLAGIELPAGNMNVIRSRDTSPISNLSIENQVGTGPLLDALLHSGLSPAPDPTGEQQLTEELLWVGRLVQRFEVNKKLFAAYRPGFRKGVGASNDLWLYCRFALVLALAHTRYKGLQHLSTLLKVNDLLLSVPPTDWGACGQHSAALAVSVELHAVGRIATRQGVTRSAL